MMSSENSEPEFEEVPSRTGPGTGTLSFLAVITGSLGALMVLLLAGGASVWEWFRGE